MGASGHGREVLDIVEAVNEAAATYDFLGFLDDNGGESDVLGRRHARVLGATAELERIDADYVIGLGSPAIRREIDALATAFGRSAATVVHPSATRGSDLHLGPGLVMAAGARITTNVTVGRHVHLNVNATVSHDCRLGDYVTLSPGASVSGNVALGDDVTMGVGAVAIQGVTVGDRTVVGAGAVVVVDLAGDVTAVGVPARPLLRAQ